MSPLKECLNHPHDACYCKEETFNKMKCYLQKMLTFSDARGLEMKRTPEESSLADEISDLLAGIEGK